MSNSLRPPWTAACQASLSFTISWSLLKLMSIESVMPSNHLFLFAPFSCPQYLSQHQGLFQSAKLIEVFFLFLRKCAKIFFLSQKGKIRYGCKSFVGYYYQNLLIPSFYHLLIQHYFLDAYYVTETVLGFGNIIVKEKKGNRKNKTKPSVIL